MQPNSHTSSIATLLKLTFFLLILSAFTFSQILPKEQKVTSRIAYAHLFNLIVAAADSMDQDWKDHLKSQTGLTDNQYEFLRALSYQFDAEFQLGGKREMALPGNYKAKLIRQLSPLVFDRLDRFVMNEIAPGIKVVRSDSASPQEFSYFSSISANEQTHILKGVSVTVTFSFSPLAPQATCSVSAAMTGPGVSLSGSDSGDCGNYNPRVTLTASNYQMNSEYCIAGSHSGSNGQSGTTNQCVTTTDPPHISKVEYEQITSDDDLISANPNAGGGRRIYPDKKIPTETGVDRRKMRVKAQYSTATAGISIYFRNFDLDDPSASAAPLDTNDSGGVNGGDDNYGNVDGNAVTRSGVLVVPGTGEPNPFNCQAFINGTVSGVVCETDSTGTAKVDFIVTKQPGDNFSVAASADETHSIGLVLTADGANVKDSNNIQMPVTTVAANGCANYSFRSCRTEMITVWRRLHIEMDSMGNIGTGNKVTGTINGSFTIPKWNGLQPSYLAVAVNTPPTLDLDKFRNGRLVVGNHSLFIAGNDASNLAAGNTTSKAISLNNGDAFTLYDDDDYNADDTQISSGSINYASYLVDGDSSEMLNELTNARRYLSAEDGNYADGKPKNVYGSAYIMPEYNWAANVANLNQTNITFDANVESLDQEVPPDELYTALNTNRGSKDLENDDFWAAYFLLGYQGNPQEDADGCKLNSLGTLCEADPTGQFIIGEQGNTGISRRLISSVPMCDCYQSTACPASQPPNHAPHSCTVLPTGAFGSVFYQEVEQDTRRSWLLAGNDLDEIPTLAPHELGHQFGLLGDQFQTTFKMMDYSVLPNTINDMALHAEHINLIRRRVKSPGK